MCAPFCKFNKPGQCTPWTSRWHTHIHMEWLTNHQVHVFGLWTPCRHGENSTERPRNLLASQCLPLRRREHTLRCCLSNLSSDLCTSLILNNLYSVWTPSTFLLSHFPQQPSLEGIRLFIYQIIKLFQGKTLIEIHKMTNTTVLCFLTAWHPLPHIPGGKIRGIRYQTTHVSHHILHANEFQLINVQREQIGNIWPPPA